MQNRTDTKKGAAGDDEYKSGDAGGKQGGGEWEFDEGKLYTMVYLYTAIMHGWQIRRLPISGKDRFELLKSGRPVPSLVDLVDWKTLPKMMYLYVAIMQGWQTRLLESEGKHSFELLRGHLGRA